MTFLEFVCNEQLGPPLRHGAPGESYWICPQCDRPKFHTRPSGDGYKDRFSCFRCDWWGDVFDLLKHFHPDEDYDARLIRFDKLHRQYRREGAPSVIFRRGWAGSKPVKRRVDPAELAGAFESLSDPEIDLLIAARAVMRQYRHLSIDDLSEYCEAERTWAREMAEFRRLMRAENERGRVQRLGRKRRGRK